MVESENLKKLKELTPKLHELILPISDNPGEHIIEYKCAEGTAIAFGLYKEEDVGVQRVFMSKGTKFPEHNHEEHEYILVYKGKVKKITNFGAFVEILPGKEGLLHISEIALERVNRVEDHLKVGQEIEVKLLKVTPDGKFDLSRKVLLKGEA